MVSNDAVMVYKFTIHHSSDIWLFQLPGIFFLIWDRPFDSYIWLFQLSGIFFLIWDHPFNSYELNCIELHSLQVSYLTCKDGYHIAVLNSLWTLLYMQVYDRYVFHDNPY